MGVKQAAADLFGDAFSILAGLYKNQFTLDPPVGP